MKNAKELHAIATEKKNLELAKQRERAVSTLANVIEPRMEDAAQMGEWSISFHVDANIDIGVIITELVAHNYRVSRTGRHLVIDWR